MYTYEIGVLSHFERLIFSLQCGAPPALVTSKFRSRMFLIQPASDDGSGHVPYNELMELGDERLMQELQAGNTDAFAIVFKRYHRLVHATALHILRDAHEAEDLTQSVFLEIYRRAGQFDARRGTLKVWLLQYAYSRSINRRNYLLVRHFYSRLEDDAYPNASQALC